MKFRYLVGFAALALMASCSNQENESPAPVVPIENAEPWVYDESLPVPVEFATAQVMVKSEVTSISNLQVGIFGLNKNGGWDAKVAEDTLIYNRRATINASNNVVLNSARYYPMESKVDYNFYGYYPYSETLAETSEPSRYCRVTYPEIGTIDILWAKDTAETTDEGITGFNARYVRAVRTNPDGKGGLPHLEFQHVLTALTFSVKAAGDAELSNVVFRGIKLTNIQKGATLMIADRYKEIEGYVTSAGEKGDIPLKRNDSDNGDYQVIPQVDPTALSGTLMVVPAASYTAEISLTISGEARTIPVTLRREGSFEAGKKYSLTLAIMNPETVSITSELIPWDPVDGGEIVIGD